MRPVASLTHSLSMKLIVHAVNTFKNKPVASSRLFKATRPFQTMKRMRYFLFFTAAMLFPW